MYLINCKARYGESYMIETKHSKTKSKQSIAVTHLAVVHTTRVRPMCDTAVASSIRRLTAALSGTAKTAKT